MSLYQLHLSSHMRQTTQGGTFRCDRGDCGKVFSADLLLRRHLCIHDNNLMLCYFCPWGGATHNQLMSHMNHHCHIRPFKCAYCILTFYSFKDRRRHEESFHEKIHDRCKCDMCSFVTHSEVILFTHRRKEHKSKPR